ncbi:hypothetical protein ZWY2020_050336 [Hordeum vulgare]|nr:hypothetical protein ZWY2020_050336 [Hordeum vulgare]
MESSTAAAHAEATSHTNFAESTEAVLNLVCADCGKPCRSQTVRSRLPPFRPPSKPGGGVYSLGILLLELLTSKSPTHASLQGGRWRHVQHMQEGGGREKREERKEMGGRRESLC